MTLWIEAVSKHFGGLQALCDVSISFAAGEFAGLIGPNGSGKTTLINCISGLCRPDA
ncbi:MAG TPA: ATP-binding cassette domain-containing protein, partial [Candidatus Methylomirabilis sp.]|nr:ATP-binding cassette domain-containing protein [Candidatus Methylomirabilis sp.]